MNAPSTPKGPVLPALTLPELETVTCETCSGLGWLERHVGDFLLTDPCPGCYGAKEVEVCSACKEPLDVSTDRCGCPESEHQAWVAEQLELGKQWGWL